VRLVIPKQGLHQIENFDHEAGARELADRGYRVFLLPCGIRDKHTFFEGIREVLPLDPPVLSDYSWDALSDSLFTGLDGIDAGGIAIIWPGSAEMAKAQPEDFEIAKSIWSDLTDLLADIKKTVGNVKHVVVILA